ncbi:(deoxy)nucleoside triphosphate pyrophosphohydrolase [Macrococcus hajekii]|uniref:8-oxo-dGTP diphosphatase n=1 Tax=Macrococcus hajekii TaxID=198482 RepID=A0A4R6BLW2_9STAP|nr:(deoxy)nucleoside triphosphate pyrophosphohydrolase [Macrococcus hajekii]TDM02622.1 (deoxy)nucleoside triphosphate pyrophosphohydrolase [Macrococcus hajekii]GGB02562.1 DNA mismatch repair protein MutT [Macrococcus hajekii]
MKKYIRVVGAVITKDNMILCAQRSESMSLPLLWEFPGGKIESNEQPEDALKRELKEEMNCTILVNDKVVTTVHEYEFATIELTTYYSNIISGDIYLAEHKQIKWLPANELFSLEWAPADIPAVKKVMEDA